MPHDFSTELKEINYVISFHILLIAKTHSFIFSLSKYLHHLQFKEAKKQKKTF